MADLTTELRTRKCCDCGIRWEYEVLPEYEVHNLVRCCECALDIWKREQAA